LSFVKDCPTPAHVSRVVRTWRGCWAGVGQSLTIGARSMCKVRVSASISIDGFGAGSAAKPRESAGRRRAGARRKGLRHTDVPAHARQGVDGPGHSPQGRRNDRDRRRLPGFVSAISTHVRCDPVVAACPVDIECRAVFFTALALTILQPSLFPGLIHRTVTIELSKKVSTHSVPDDAFESRHSTSPPIRRTLGGCSCTANRMWRCVRSGSFANTEARSQHTGL
jgi:hypothetical protein